MEMKLIGKRYFKQRDCKLHFEPYFNNIKFVYTFFLNIKKLKKLRNNKT